MPQFIVSGYGLDLIKPVDQQFAAKSIEQFRLMFPHHVDISCTGFDFDECWKWVAIELSHVNTWPCYGRRDAFTCFGLETEMDALRFKLRFG